MEMLRKRGSSKTNNLKDSESIPLDPVLTRKKKPASPHHTVDEPLCPAPSIIKVHSGSSVVKKEHKHVPRLSLQTLDGLEHISSSSSSSLVTPNTMDRFMSSVKNTKIIDDCPGKLTSNGTRVEVSTSGEDSRSNCVKSPNEVDEPYEKYKDGLRRKNKKSFQDVQFCFICDSRTPDLQHNPCIERTGMRFDSTGEFTTVYKQIFCCDECYTIIQNTKESNTNYNVIIRSTQALDYY